jgi:hypothetical protein
MKLHLNKLRSLTWIIFFGLVTVAFGLMVLSYKQGPAQQPQPGSLSERLALRGAPIRYIKTISPGEIEIALQSSSDNDH